MHGVHALSHPTLGYNLLEIRGFPLMTRKPGSAVRTVQREAAVLGPRLDKEGPVVCKERESQAELAASTQQGWRLRVHYVASPIPGALLAKSHMGTMICWEQS